ncbi:MAG: phosphoglucosamine mutase [Oscillospiraceae bacterium]
MGRLFGTDGVRGIANSELTCSLAIDIGKAAATVLSGRRHKKPLFLVGMDTRISSDMLSCAISAGLCSAGADVIVLGVIPTPAVAYLVGKYKADAGIMISASHNPAEFNGIKIFSGNGFKLPDELEEKIEDLIIKEECNTGDIIGEHLGKITYVDTAIKDYSEYLKSTVFCSLSGINIAIDCANGAASKVAPNLFKELGAECHILHASPDGININDDCGSTNMQSLKDYVLNNHLDAGIAFDGDADRCLIIDNEGNEVDGDFIMAICALDLKERGKLKKDTVVGTIMTNLGFIKFCEKYGLNFIPTKVGDRYVLEEMLLEDYKLGGEQSGHIIFSDYATTGDGELTALQVLNMLVRKNEKLSELTKVMTRYPQVMVNVRVTPEGKIAFYTDEAVNAAIEDGKKKLEDSGRIVVRISGTEPLIRVMAEGEDIDFITDIVNEIADVIKNNLT